MLPSILFALERGLRSERALKLAIAEMYVAILMEISEDWESRQSLFETGGELIESHNEIYRENVALSPSDPGALRLGTRPA